MQGRITDFRGFLPPTAAKKPGRKTKAGILAAKNDPLRKKAGRAGFAAGEEESREE